MSGGGVFEGVVTMAEAHDIDRAQGLAPAPEIDTISKNDPTQGRKLDTQKLKYDLIDPRAKREVAKVLRYGVVKYTEGNWLYVPDAKARYIVAGERHFKDWCKRETTDPETNASHVAHGICCQLFVLGFEHGPEKLSSLRTDVDIPRFDLFPYGAMDEIVAMNQNRPSNDDVNSLPALTMDALNLYQCTGDRQHLVTSTMWAFAWLSAILAGKL